MRSTVIRAQLEYQRGGFDYPPVWFWQIPNPATGEVTVVDMGWADDLPTAHRDARRAVMRVRALARWVTLAERGAC
jgi:hypothetical protein